MNKVFIPISFIFMCACSTMNESLQLGAAVGAASGAAATYAAHASTGRKPAFENVAVGAGVGLGLGFLISHYIFRSVEETRATTDKQQFEINFGDLPPSPFVVPGMKGGQQ